MRRNALGIVVLAACLLAGCTSIPVLKAQKTPRNETEFKNKWELVWSDEFEKNGPVDPKKWSFQTGGHGWGNQELQHYTTTTDNARIEDGHLIIEARKEQFKDNAYTSARLNSMGHFQYGRFEVRAKIPRGRGTWPAIWMMPYKEGKYNKGSWPDNGEIDIMEHVGYDQGTVHATLHTKAYNWMDRTQKSGQIMVRDLSEDFHTYELEWTADKMDLFVDGQKFYSYANPHKTDKEWPFDQPFFFILNVAVGGHWGGKQGIDETIWPQRMVVDYVRAYKATGPVAAPLAAQD